MKLGYIDLQLFADPAGNPSGGDGGSTGSAGGTPADTTGTNPTGGGTSPQVPDGYIHKDQVSHLIQTRLAEEKQKYGDVEGLRRFSEKMKKITGKDLTDLEKELDQMDTQRQAAQMNQGGQAQGQITPEAYQRLKAAEENSAKALDSTLEIRLDNEENALIASNALYGDLKTNADLRKNVRDYAKKNNVGISQAYWAIQGPNKYTEMEKQTEQRIQAQMQERFARGGVMGNSAGPELEKLGLNQEEVSMAAKMGMSPQDYAAYGKMTNLDDFLKHRANKPK